MRAQIVWKVDLPLKFCIGNNFKKTRLTQFSFNINDINFELLKCSSGDVIDRVKITTFEDYDERYLPSCENAEYLSEFTDKTISISI